MSAITKLRWVEVSESDTWDVGKGTAVFARTVWGAVTYFKLQAQVMDESGLHWVDVPIAGIGHEP